MDISVIFPTTGLMFGGIADAAVNNALCRAYNDWLRTYCDTDTHLGCWGWRWCRKWIRRLMVAEARRAIDDLGFVIAVMLRPNVIADRTLDHPAYDGLVDAVGRPGGARRLCTRGPPRMSPNRDWIATTTSCSAMCAPIPTSSRWAAWS